MSTDPPIGSPDQGGISRCRAFDVTLGVLIAAVPLSFSFLAPYTLKWAIVGFLTPIAAFLWLWGGCGRPFRPFPTLAAPLVALLVASELSLLQALNVYYGLQRFIFLLVLFLLYLTVAYTSARPDRRNRIIGYLVLTLLGASALSLAGCVIPVHAGLLSPVQVLFRLFGNTNYGAAYLITVIPLSLALFSSVTRREEKLLWGTTLFLSMMLLSLSMVRGAWVSIAFGFGILLWALSRGEGSPCTIRGMPRLPLVAGALIVGAAIVAATTFSPVCLSGQEQLGQRVASIVDPGTPSLQIRLALWEGTLQMIRDHVWTGVGIGNFTLASVPYRPAVIYQQPGVRLEHPHSEYLNLWAEVGPLGLLALLWLFVRVVRLGWHLVHRRGVQRDIVAGMLGGLAAAAAYAGLFYVVHVPASGMTVAILLGLLDGMYREAGPDDRAAPVRRTPLVIGLVVMLAVGVEYFLRPLAGEVHYWRAERSFHGKRIDEGLTRLEHSLAWHSQSYQARYRRAAIFYAMGRYPDTIREAEMAIKIHPQMDVAYGIMASAYLNLGEKATAKAIFKRALGLNPNYPHALNNLGVLAADEGRFAEAEGLFLRAQEILGRSEMGPFRNLGDLYEKTGRMREALQMYETAAGIQPKSGATWYHVARLRALNGDHGHAYEDLARAIALDEAWRGRAANERAFAAMRESDPRVRGLLYPSLDGRGRLD